jgi:hypothetical protein
MTDKTQGPEPMTDAEIEEIWMTAPQGGPHMRQQLNAFARAIIAARDAQWREWMGRQETVLWYSHKSDELIAQKQQDGLVNKVICGTGKTGDFTEPLYLHPAATVQHTALLRQALEALEEADYRCHGMDWTAEIEPTITAIKEALG